MLVLRDINDHQIEKMVAYAKAEGIMLQLIELIKTDENFFEKHYFNLSPMEQKLTAEAEKIIETGMQGRKRYQYNGSVIEVVGPHRHDFCANCTKLRITNEGKIKPCLIRDQMLDFQGGKHPSERH